MVRGKAFGAVLAGVLAFGTPGSAWARQAQHDPPPSKAPEPAPQPPAANAPGTDPQLTSEGVEGTLEAMRKRGAGSPRPVAPTLRTSPSASTPRAGQARGTDPDLGVPGARRLREGTFISRRTGTLLRARTGDWIFVPRPSADATLDNAMVLVPSQTLERLEGALAPGVERPSVSISGQVLMYRGHEYLLPGEPSIVLVEAPVPEPAAQAPGDAAPDPNARAENLIRELESRRPEARALNPVPPRPAAPAGEGEASKPLVEGALITARRGRVVRGADGQLAFAPDNDAEGAHDRAMILAPCQTLTRMEEVSLWRGDGLVLEVSGRVLAYRGKAYLLPTMFVVPAPGDVTPLQ